MKKTILSLVFILSFSYAALGQISVKGKVVDESGKPLPSVTILIKGTKKGVLTDLNGDFEIEVESKKDTLSFSYIFTKPKEWVIKEITASEAIELQTIDLQKSEIVDIYYISNSTNIGYYGGTIYTPFGLYAQTTFYKPLSFLKNISLFGGYSTDFNKNHNYFGGLGFKVKKIYITYRFEQNNFFKRENSYLINTHTLKSGNKISKKYSLNYGIGYQEFETKNINLSQKNWGASLGLGRYFSKINTNFSVISIYFQDYWNWQVGISKYFQFPLSLGITYNRVNSIFNELNLTVGYSFSKTSIK